MPFIKGGILVPFLIVGLASCVHENVDVRQPASLAMNTSDLTFQDLKNDISANKITNSEQLLNFFSKNPKYQPFVQNAVLERRSFALHKDQVNSDFPRIIMSNGNLTLHLTGDRSKLGGISRLPVRPYLHDQCFTLVVEAS
jgi:hypothetical protein